MDYVNLAWLDLLPCKTLLQSVWLYSEGDMVMQVWNYALYHLPMFKNIAVVIGDSVKTWNINVTEWNQSGCTLNS